MSNYADRLRRDKRSELAKRALPVEVFNEYGEVFAVTKTEGGASFPASDYAYVPDPESPSTWKLRLTSTPGGDPDPKIVGAAIAALGKGFRGNKVEIPAADLAAVKAKVEAAWKKANPDKNPDEIPSFSLEEEEGYESEEFGTLPPALAKQIVKKLQGELAAEKDPKKKAEIQAKIDKFSK